MEAYLRNKGNLREQVNQFLINYLKNNVESINFKFMGYDLEVYPFETDKLDELSEVYIFEAYNSLKIRFIYLIYIFKGKGLIKRVSCSAYNFDQLLRELSIYLSIIKPIKV